PSRASSTPSWRPFLLEARGKARRCPDVYVPGVAPSADTYTAAQAAQILGVSERRVRQLVNEGKLTGNRDNNGQVRVAQRSVTEERKRRRKRVDGASRRGPASAPPATPGPSLDVGGLARAVANRGG